MVIIDPDQYSGQTLSGVFLSRMQPGGMIFVDYRGVLAEGVNKAVDEFLADKPESMEQILQLSGTCMKSQ